LAGVLLGLIVQPNIIELWHSDKAATITDFKSVRGNGIFALVHKATQDTSYRDPMFHDRVRAAQDAGMLTGAYHVLTLANIHDQADIFLSATRPFDDGNFALFVLYEKSNAPPALHQVVQFMQVVEDETKSLCGLYSGTYIRETLVPQAGGYQQSSMQTIDSFFASRRLWLAEYGPHQNIPWPWSEYPNMCDIWDCKANNRTKQVIGDIDFAVSPYADMDALSKVWKNGPPSNSPAVGLINLSDRSEMKT
jgi:GH25 family lysozyme M1 (1,4-beta-N-acetylmuramidase)